MSYTHAMSTMKSSTIILFSLLVWLAPATVHAQFDHGEWERLLGAHVEVLAGGSVTRVDYAGMQEEATALTAYLAATAAVAQPEFAAWSTADQLAFLINVYNAATVRLILTDYPAIDSIRDLGSLFRSPWSKPVVSLFGGQVSLDEIEHEMIRGSGRYNEPRIHFAVNCAAIGCPPLRSEAYVGDKLEQQLDDNTRLFLQDRSRNYASGNRLHVSKIFDWYETDFEQGWQGIDSVAGFLLRYAGELGLDAPQHEALAKGAMRIRYLSYDWGLNRKP